MARFSPLSGEGFEQLLRACDADPQRASVRYQALRRRLVWFFETKGSRAPEDHADETLTRIARKLGGGEVIQQVETYALGVARYVLLESMRRTVETSLNDDVPEPASDEEGQEEGEEARVRCMESCLSSFSGSDRDLILTYYLGERRGRIDARRALADRLGIPVSALRIRVFRLRQRLHGCVLGCVERGVAVMNPAVPSVPGVRSIADGRAGAR